MNTEHIRHVDAPPFQFCLSFMNDIREQGEVQIRIFHKITVSDEIIFADAFAEAADKPTLWAPQRGHFLCGLYPPWNFKFGGVHGIDHQA